MTPTPAPESVRRFARQVEEGLSLVEKACADLRLELRPSPPGHDFPPDRPATDTQLRRIANRLDSKYLSDDERAPFQQRVERGLTYAEAHALIARLDRELERRADAERKANSER